MAKNRKDYQTKDAVREFYSVIEEIRDLYEKQGYLKAKSLFLFMQDKQKWQMTYSTFCRYFNKEIKSKTPKEKPLIDNNYQFNQKQEKEIKDEKQQISTINEKEEMIISDETKKRFKEQRALMQPSVIAMAQCAKENFKKQQEEEEK